MLNSYLRLPNNIILSSSPFAGLFLVNVFKCAFSECIGYAAEKMPALAFMD